MYYSGIDPQSLHCFAAIPHAQLATLKRIWYSDGHYSGVRKIWELLRRQAEAEGAPPFFDIRRRQLRKWVTAREAKQLMRVPERPKVFRPFGYPSEPSPC